MITQEKQCEQEPAVQRATCANCPYFNPNQGVQGWCSVFDRMAKPRHERTNICDLEIKALEKTQSQPEHTLPQWTVTWDDKWHWYTVWVGDSYAGCATKSEDAERLAQKYIASQKFWQEHRKRVIAAYACV